MPCRPSFLFLLSPDKDDADIGVDFQGETDLGMKSKRVRIAWVSVAIVVAISILVTVLVWPRGALTRGDVAGVWVSDARPGQEPTRLELHLDGKFEAANMPFSYLLSGEPNPDEPVLAGSGGWTIDEQVSSGQQLGLGFPDSDGDLSIGVTLYFERTPFGLTIYRYIKDPDQSDSKLYFHRER
jgi:hypothetical protein